MKRSGIVRRMDSLGRICIPRELLRVLNIKNGDPLEIGIGDDGAISLAKYHPAYEASVVADDLKRVVEEAEDLHMDTKAAVIVKIAEIAELIKTVDSTEQKGR